MEERPLAAVNDCSSSKILNNLARLSISLVTVLLLGACSQQLSTLPASDEIDSTLPKSSSSQNVGRPAVLAETLVVEGKWITERDGSTMLDPQTSGLIADENVWWSISDASAHDSQTNRLHLIDKQSATVVQRFGPMVLSERVANSCFADYLSAKPDYEAMVFHPYLEDAWILVTEDASRGKHKQLVGDCKRHFENSGSTKYPTLLVEIVLRNSQLVVSGVRALQFSVSDRAGDSPNDGFEGLAFGRDNRLFLALEKDLDGKARIFYVDVERDYFAQENKFSLATDAKLHLPNFAKGNHPINALAMHFPDEQSQGFLIAAARNDNQIWIVDVSKKLPTKIVPMDFYAPAISEKCPDAYEMNNASIEGLAVDGDILVLANDPWRSQYHKNAVCEYDKIPFERYSPLIFTTKLLSSWFSAD